MIGERLSEIRKDYGQKQEDLAKILHVSVGTLRGWEQDRNSPSHEMLVKICRLYHVSSDYLLGLSDIDPVYERQRRRAVFNKDELEQLRDYESYLLWKKRQKSTDSP